MDLIEMFYSWVSQHGGNRAQLGSPGWLQQAYKQIDLSPLGLVLLKSFSHVGSWDKIGSGLLDRGHYHLVSKC